MEGVMSTCFALVCLCGLIDFYEHEYVYVYVYAYSVGVWYYTRPLCFFLASWVSLSCLAFFVNFLPHFWLDDW